MTASSERAAEIIGHPFYEKYFKAACLIRQLLGKDPLPIPEQFDYQTLRRQYGWGDLPEDHGTWYGDLLRASHPLSPRNQHSPLYLARHFGRELHDLRLSRRISKQEMPPLSSFWPKSFSYDPDFRG